MKYYHLIIATILFLTFGNAQVWAQSSVSGIAKSISINDTAVFNGALICSSGTGFKMCTTAYDPSLYGVVADNPSAYIDTGTVENGRLILSDGITSVRVSDKNGVIKKGDYVTSSETPGLAIKATDNGYVLGSAIDNPAQAPTGENLVTVAINIHAEAKLSGARSNLIAVLRDASKAPLLEPLAAFRYVLAALLVVISFTLGFIYFGRMANTGVEAIGRNPLAEGLIRRNVMLHVVVTIVIVGVGLFASYLVLIL